MVEGSEISSRFILKFSKNGAPFKELGCFVVVRITESNSFFTDLIASKPDIAPDGRYTFFLILYMHQTVFHK